MEGIQQIGLAHPVVSGKAIDFFTECQLGIRVIFKIDELEFVDKKRLHMGAKIGGYGDREVLI